MIQNSVQREPDCKPDSTKNQRYGGKIWETLARVKRSIAGWNEQPDGIKFADTATRSASFDVWAMERDDLRRALGVGRESRSQEVSISLPRPSQVMLN